MGRHLRANLILLPLAISAIIPLWVMVIAAFQIGDKALDFSMIVPVFKNLSWHNLFTVWRDGNFSRYFVNSLVVSFLITLGNIVFDSMVAYALARRKFRGRRLLIGLITVKLMIPAAVLLVPTFRLIQFLQLYDTYLALVLPLLTETFGIFILKQYIENIPLSYEESARLEGASEFKIFWSIILPLSAPALAVVAVHSVMTSWNMYIYPLILTASDSMRTLPLGISFYSASNPEITTGELMAAALISAAPVLIVFLIFQRKIITSMTQGALKG
ncbi:MAG: carbohydrate ABC transporter permease [SAR324 cluster bacterium]|nr:carbohydrate ABC transporter permease [SAR324 cluster bacterium]